MASRSSATISTEAPGHGGLATGLLTLMSGPGALRMGLALLVFLSHVSRYEVGRPAVVIFFMLSGYWVARLYDQARQAQPGRPLRAALNFEIDRALRIWPLFALVAALAVLIGAAFDLPERGNLLSTLPLLGLASRHGDLLGVSWSLDLEMQFYLLLPLLLLALTRLDLRGRTADSVLLLGMCTLAGAWLLSRGIQTIATFAPAFALGAMIHALCWRPSLRTAMLSMAAFLMCALVFIIVPEFNTLLLKTESFWWRDLIHMAWCLLLAPFIAWNVHQPSGAFDRHLGNLSYPFYLVHPLMITLAFALIGKHHGTGAALALLLSTALAVALYVSIDRPIERLRRRIVRRGLGSARTVRLPGRRAF